MEISYAKEDEAVVESMPNSPMEPFLDFQRNSKSENTELESEPGPPHEALFLALAYLPVFELLNMSEVCTQFRDAVNKDVLPWLNIVIDRPLSSRLSDEILMRITSKANCGLKTLILRNCFKITDDGIQKVIEENPSISKLHLPGCTGLKPEGIIRAVETLTQHKNHLKSLQINGIYNLKKQHLEILSSRLKPASEETTPVLYRCYRTSPSPTSIESDRIIDVDVCPKCDEVKIVFDCPRENCRLKRDPKFTDCRGCYYCITRCEECGGCVDAEEQEDSACGDILCSDCWLHLTKCNHCNKPYCKRHINQRFSSPGCTGFICEACHYVASGNSSPSD